MKFPGHARVDRHLPSKLEPSSYVPGCVVSAISEDKPLDPGGQEGCLATEVGSEFPQQVGSKVYVHEVLN